ncbi:MAG: dihydrofolate reductase family protein [Nanoarchaeota archaeon]|nr:dihydrofolate reductase family protein [Nanoarchaeota archaeon]
MKIVLYMAMTVNGYIAGKENETPWSQEEWSSYAEAVKRSKAIIIGRNTYELMRREKEFEKIGNPRTIVVSKKIKSSEKSNFAFVNNPKEAISLLEKEDYEEVLVAGGSKLNSSFIKENLIDEIYLDIEPHLFGNGIKLFTEDDFSAGLELISTKLISKNEIQLHYKIIK